MSSKDNTMSSVSKNYEYRKKKQDKSKRFSRDKKNNKFEDCNDFVNDLPDGIFDKKSDFDSSHFLSKNIEKTNNLIQNEEVVETSLNVSETIEDDTSDVYNASYFEPTVYKGK